MWDETLLKQNLDITDWTRDNLGNDLYLVYSFCIKYPIVWSQVTLVSQLITYLLKPMTTTIFVLSRDPLVFLHHNNIIVFSLYPLSEYSSQFLLMNSNEILLDVFLAARGYVLLRIQHISTISFECITIFSFKNNFGKKTELLFWKSSFGYDEILKALNIIVKSVI